MGGHARDKGVFMSALGNRSIENSEVQENSEVKVEELASLTGFPVEFLKSELLIDGEEIELSNLREKVLAYLDRTVSNHQEF